MWAGEGEHLAVEEPMDSQIVPERQVEPLHPP